MKTKTWQETARELEILGYVIERYSYNTKENRFCGHIRQRDEKTFMQLQQRGLNVTARECGERGSGITIRWEIDLTSPMVKKAPKIPKAPKVKKK